MNLSKDHAQYIKISRAVGSQEIDRFPKRHLIRMFNQHSHKLVTWIFVHVILLDSGYFTTDITAAPSPILTNGETGLSRLLQSAQKTVTTFGDVTSSAKGQARHVFNETMSKLFGRSRQTSSSSSRQEFAPQISLSSSSSSSTSFGNFGGASNYSGVIGSPGGSVVQVPGQTHHVVVEHVVSSHQPFNASNFSQSQSQSTSWTQSSNGGADHFQQLSRGSGTDFGSSLNSGRLEFAEDEDDIPTHALEFSAKGGSNRGSSIVHSRRTMSGGGGSGGHNHSNGFGAGFSGSGTTTIRQSSVSTKTVSHSRKTVPQAETSFSVIRQRNSSGNNNITPWNASLHQQQTTGGLEISKQTFQELQVVEEPVVRVVNVTKLGSEQYNTSITQEERTNSSISADQTFEDAEDSDEVEVVTNLNQALSLSSNSEKIMQVQDTSRTSSEDRTGTGSGVGNFSGIENKPLIANQAHSETDLNLTTTRQETGNGNTAQEQQVSQSVAENNDSQSKFEISELSSAVVRVSLDSTTIAPVPVKVFQNDEDVEVDVVKNQQQVPPMSLTKSPSSVRATTTTTMKPTISTTSRAPATSAVTEVVSANEEKVITMLAPTTTTSTTTSTGKSSKANFRYAKAIAEVGTSTPSLSFAKTVVSAATSDSDIAPFEATSQKSANCGFKSVTEEEDNSTEFVDSLHYSSAKCEREIGVLLEEIWFLHVLLLLTCFLCLLVLFVLPMILCHMSKKLLLKYRNKAFVSSEPVEVEISCVEAEKKAERSESSRPSAENAFKGIVDHSSSKLIATTSLQSSESSCKAPNNEDGKREAEKTMKSNILLSTQQICNESGKSTLWNIDKELLQKRSHQNVYIDYKTPRRPGPVPLANSTDATTVVTTKTGTKTGQDYQKHESGIKFEDLNQIGKENYYETVEEKESCIIVPPSTPKEEKSAGKVPFNSANSKSATIPGHPKDATMNLDNFSSSPSSEIALNHDRAKDVSKLKYEFLMGSSAETTTNQSASANFNSFLDTYNRLEKRLEIERKRVRSGDVGATRVNNFVTDAGLQLQSSCSIPKRSATISGSFLQHSTKSGNGALFNDGSTLIVNKKEGWFKFESGGSSPSSVTKVQKIIQVDDDVY